MSGRFNWAPAEFAAVIAAMQREFYREERLAYSDATAAAMVQLLGDPSLGGAHLIECEGVAAGYYVLLFGFSVERGGRIGLLDELYVAPEWRGRGLGRAALREAVSAARRAGCRALLLEVDHENRRARHLYEGAGFQALARDLLALPLE